MPLPMYYKFFTILIVVIAFVATIAGAITPQVIGQQNQTSNLTALLTQAPDNDTATEVPANITANNVTTTNPASTTVTNTDALDNMTIEDAKDLYLSVWNQTEFNATFSTFVEPFSAAGYGVYEERNNIFTPGETIVLYVEPVGFAHEQIIDERGDSNNNTTLYLMNMTADYEIAAANGTELELQLIEDAQDLRNITSHRPNTEMFLTLTLTPEIQPLPTGTYVLTYSLTDEISGESFQLEKDITIAERD
jgi:hypothetical protein